MTSPGPAGPGRPPGRSPVRFESIAKPGGGVRRLSRLDPADGSDLTSAVERIAPRIERSLGSEVVANRVRGPNLELTPWQAARGRWLSDIEKRLRAARPPVVLIADVRDFYPSVRPGPLARALLDLGVPHGDLLPVLNMLKWFREDGVDGLPIGPEPSAVLANAILGQGDRALRESGTPHLRWVDDVVAFARDVPHAIRAADALRRSLRSAGLALHEGKTRVVSDPLEARAVLIPGSSSPAAGPAVA